MGGGYYEGDIAERLRSSTTDDQIFRSQGMGARNAIDPTLNIKGKTRECRDSGEHPRTTPIVVAMDFTLSRGDDAKVVFSKVPMFFGQIKLRQYAAGPEICWVGIGDATSDKAPIQVAQFESDNKLDDWLAKMWLEGGGGGTGQESYELAAYVGAYKMELDAVTRGEKGFWFFLGDEGFYPRLSKEQVRKYIGDDLPEDLDSAVVFRELQKKFHVFFIYPRKPWTERKSDIDAEMRDRLELAGGRFLDVDIRASLRWDTYDDLDLHCIVPGGGEIFYSNNTVRKGKLDVDRNAGRKETRKPVENIRWAKGDAPKGKYKVFVRNFAFHEDNPRPIPFILELEVNGKIEKFEGVASPKGETSEKSDVTCFEFNYDPNQRTVSQDETDLYRGYDDTLIRSQWERVLPQENILMIDDPRSIVDTMLGAIALVSGSSIDEYLGDMESRGQTSQRREDTTQALSGLAEQRSTQSVDLGNLPKADSKQVKKRAKIKRL